MSGFCRCKRARRPWAGLKACATTGRRLLVAQPFRAALVAIALSGLTLSASTDRPLIQAVKNKDITTVRALLKQRVDVNAAEADGTTALHWASHRDDLGIADAL